MIEEYAIHIIVILGIYCLLGLSLNLVAGFGGILNLGHVAFFGIGTYTSALFSLKGTPLIICFILGGLFAGLAGFLLSFASTRLKKDYFALATLAFNFAIYSLILNLNSITGGAQGISGIPRILGVWISLAIMAALCLGCYFITKKVVKSGFGKSLQATRDNELLAESLGKNSLSIKSSALAFSAVVAGLAGSIYAHHIGFVNPSSLGLGETIFLLTIIIMGGIASLKGTMVAATVLILIPELLRFTEMPSSILGPARAIIYASLLLAVIAFRPKGLFGKIDLA